MTTGSDSPVSSPKLFGGKRANAYEDRVRQVVPGYDALHDLSLLNLNREIGIGGHVLIAGCGSGNDILSLSRECPDRQFTAFDPSADMMEITKARITEAQLASLSNLLTGTIDDVKSDQEFDAATLMLVMHFIADQDGRNGKAHLLKGISARLKPGAPFVFAEALADRNAPDFDADLDLWRKIMCFAGMDPTDEEKGFKKIVSKMALIGEDRLRTLLDQAGFEPPQLFYRAHLIHGWITRKR